MSAPRILAIDVGTQSVRAMVFDPAGELRARAKVAIVPYVSPEPGWAEQDADYYFDSLAAACRELWAEIDPATITGVALTTQRATVVNVDAEGAPLRPAMVWPDQRRVRGEPAIGGLWGALFRVAGVRETVANVQADAESNWLRRHQPEIWRATHKLLFLSGYLTFRLVGRFVDSVGCQVGYVPFDYKALAWAGPRDWKWTATGIAPELLPELVPPGARLGTITAAAAAATGIPEGLPLIAAAADKACEVLGAGGVTPDVANLSLGTTATINTTIRRYVEVVPMIPPFPAALPGAYQTEIQFYRGFWLVSWFAAQFAAGEREAAAAKGVPVEALLEELAAAIAPGSDGLVLQPTWSPGAHIGPEARGAVIGFTENHTRAHLYRAILEGLAYALRSGKELTERRTKVPITTLRVAGGGSQSDVAMQITADVFGQVASRPHTFETSALGAAIIACVGLGVHADPAAAVRAMTRPGESFAPDPERQRLYDQLYREVYAPLYGRLQPLYRRLRGITGYPP
ncbi:MAG: FGGY-family carbohydrate kinase [Nannocystaceae bacterium]